MAAGLPVYPEDAIEAARVRRRLRRNGVIVIAILDLLVVAVALSGIADLRRMSTPAGAAGAWADAASARDCARYLDLETPARKADDRAGITVTRQAPNRDDDLCLRVYVAWRGFATQSSTVVRSGVGFDVVRLVEVDDGGPSDVMVTGEVLMSHAGGRWRVDLSPPPCRTPSYSPAQSLCATVQPPAG